MAESAYLNAKAQFETWRVTFERDWYSPQVETLYGATAKQLSSLPPDVQARSRLLNPKGWTKVDELVQKQKGV